MNQLSTFDEKRFESALEVPFLSPGAICRLERDLLVASSFPNLVQVILNTHRQWKISSHVEDASTHHLTSLKETQQWFRLFYPAPSTKEASYQDEVEKDPYQVLQDRWMALQKASTHSDLSVSTRSLSALLTLSCALLSALKAKFIALENPFYVEKNQNLPLSVWMDLSQALIGSFFQPLLQLANGNRWKNHVEAFGRHIIDLLCACCHICAFLRVAEDDSSADEIAASIDAVGNWVASLAVIRKDVLSSLWIWSAVHLQRLQWVSHARQPSTPAGHTCVFCPQRVVWYGLAPLLSAMVLGKTRIISESLFLQLHHAFLGISPLQNTPALKESERKNWISWAQLQFLIHAITRYRFKRVHALASETSSSLKTKASSSLGTLHPLLSVSSALIAAEQLVEAMALVQKQTAWVIESKARQGKASSEETKEMEGKDKVAWHVCEKCVFHIGGPGNGGLASGVSGKRVVDVDSAYDRLLLPLVFLSMRYLQSGDENHVNQVLHARAALVIQKCTRLWWTREPEEVEHQSVWSSILVLIHCASLLMKKNLVPFHLTRLASLMLFILNSGLASWIQSRVPLLTRVLKYWLLPAVQRLSAHVAVSAGGVQPSWSALLQDHALSSTLHANSLWHTCFTLLKKVTLLDASSSSSSCGDVNENEDVSGGKEELCHDEEEFWAALPGVFSQLYAMPSLYGFMQEMEYWMEAGRRRNGAELEKEVWKWILVAHTRLWVGDRQRKDVEKKIFGRGKGNSSSKPSNVIAELHLCGRILSHWNVNHSLKDDFLSFFSFLVTRYAQDAIVLFPVILYRIGKVKNGKEIHHLVNTLMKMARDPLCVGPLIRQFITPMRSHGMLRPLALQMMGKICQVQPRVFTKLLDFMHQSAKSGELEERLAVAQTCVDLCAQGNGERIFPLIKSFLLKEKEIPILVLCNYALQYFCEHEQLQLKAAIALSLENQSLASTSPWVIAARIRLQSCCVFKVHQNEEDTLRNFIRDLFKYFQSPTLYHETIQCETLSAILRIIQQAPLENFPILLECGFQASDLISYFHHQNALVRQHAVKIAETWMDYEVRLSRAILPDTGDGFPSSHSSSPKEKEESVSWRKISFANLSEKFHTLFEKHVFIQNSMIVAKLFSTVPAHVEDRSMNRNLSAQAILLSQALFYRRTLDECISQARVPSDWKARMLLLQGWSSFATRASPLLFRSICLRREQQRVSDGVESQGTHIEEKNAAKALLEIWWQRAREEIKNGSPARAENALLALGALASNLPVEHLLSLLPAVMDWLLSFLCLDETSNDNMLNSEEENEMVGDQWCRAGVVGALGFLSLALSHAGASLEIFIKIANSILPMVSQDLLRKDALSREWSTLSATLSLGMITCAVSSLSHAGDESSVSSFTKPFFLKEETLREKEKTLPCSQKFVIMMVRQLQSWIEIISCGSYSVGSGLIGLMMAQSWCSFALEQAVLVTPFDDLLFTMYSWLPKKVQDLAHWQQPTDQVPAQHTKLVSKEEHTQTMQNNLACIAVVPMMIRALYGNRISKTMVLRMLIALYPWRQDSKSRALRELWVKKVYPHLDDEERSKMEKGFTSWQGKPMEEFCRLLGSAMLVHGLCAEKVLVGKEASSLIFLFFDNVQQRLSKSTWETETCFILSHVMGAQTCGGPLHRLGPATEPNGGGNSFYAWHRWASHLLFDDVHHQLYAETSSQGLELLWYLINQDSTPAKVKRAATLALAPLTRPLCSLSNGKEGSRGRALGAVIANLPKGIPLLKALLSVMEKECTHQIDASSVGMKYDYEMIYTLRCLSAPILTQSRRHALIAWDPILENLVSEASSGLCISEKEENEEKGFRLKARRALLLEYCAQFLLRSAAGHPGLLLILESKMLSSLRFISLPSSCQCFLFRNLAPLSELFTQERAKDHMRRLYLVFLQLIQNTQELNSEKKLLMKALCEGLQKVLQAHPPLHDQMGLSRSSTGEEKEKGKEASETQVVSRISLVRKGAIRILCQLVHDMVDMNSALRNALRVWLAPVFSSLSKGELIWLCEHEQWGDIPSPLFLPLPDTPNINMKTIDATNPTQSSHSLETLRIAERFYIRTTVCGTDQDRLPLRFLLDCRRYCISQSSASPAKRVVHSRLLYYLHASLQARWENQGEPLAVEMKIQLVKDWLLDTLDLLPQAEDPVACLRIASFASMVMMQEGMQATRWICPSLLSNSSLSSKDTSLGMLVIQPALLQDALLMRTFRSWLTSGMETSWLTSSLIQMVLSSFHTLVRSIRLWPSSSNPDRKLVSQWVENGIGKYL